MNKYRSLRIILPILPSILIVVMLHSYIESASRTAPTINSGTLDLFGWDGQINASFRLAGEWEFYLDQILDNKAIKRGNASPVLVRVPYAVNRVDLNGRTLPAANRATYRIHVINAPVGSNLAIQVRHLTEAYRLYVDDQLIAANGQPGDDTWSPIADYRYQLAGFTPENSEFDIILQVFNQFDNKGEMQWPLIFGKHDDVAGIYRITSEADLISIGSIVVISLFWIITWVIIPKDKKSIILGLMGVIMLIRIMISEDLLFADLIPQMPLIVCNQIDYIFAYWFDFLIIALVYSLYPTLFPRRFIRLLSYYTLFISILVGVTPGLFFSFWGGFFDIVWVLLFMANVYIMGRAVGEKLPGAAVMFGLMSSVVVCYLYAIFTPDLALVYYIFNGTGLIFAVIFLGMSIIMAQNIKEAQYMELSALRGQIRPHFVHNALASIISISRRDPHRSRDLLVDFSTYLRGSFDYTERNLISIEQELELVKAYIALEQARFGDKYQVKYQLDARNFLMPPLILQPLVENALVHGLREKEQGGTVVIYTTLNHNKVRIGVRDDGVGIYEATGQAGLRQGVGIKNINQRLAQLYGSGLHFRIPPAGGCEVYMEIPYMEALKHESYSG